MRHVLLFGGTFDPPHVGHLLMAQLALEQSGADEVWFLPAPLPPHKVGEAHLAHDVRVRMVERLINNLPGLCVSDVESTLPRPSYTVDTIRSCIESYPDCQFQFLMGSDSLAHLPSWHEASALTELTPFIVAVRSGYPFAETLATVRRQLPNLRAVALNMPVIDVSSTFLREREAAGKPLCGLVPESVLELWRSARGT